MPADPEGDSQMVSSPETSDNDITTPRDRTIAGNIHSPPDSQHRSMPTSASGSSIANSNGKRPIQTISNGNDDVEELAAMANGKARQDAPAKTHQLSGYSWNRAEDEPGYAWTNKKAQDEYARAWEGVQHKDAMVKNRYGDPFEAVEREQAILASLKQQ
ncbi:hypothetical protein PRZ48_001483 [Zasmidium cellare]|uniref:Uncharacterized protein n=1 Tax=Zasmidium cellare TaxID=395010 RepID=A0ABR0F396_ZASCE|nr:hypothetical protein PRZ48_001483 [Zasmidium cellare]